MSEPAGVREVETLRRQVEDLKAVLGSVLVAVGAIADQPLPWQASELVDAAEMYVHGIIVAADDGTVVAPGPYETHFPMQVISLFAKRCKDEEVILANAKGQEAIVQALDNIASELRWGRVGGL